MSNKLQKQLRSGVVTFPGGVVYVVPKHGLLFPSSVSPNVPISRSAVHRAVKMAGRDIGMSNLRTHSERVSKISQIDLGSNGLGRVSPAIGMRITGHKCLQAYLRYSRPDNKQLMETQNAH